MKGKKSVLLHCDIIHTIEKLDDENAGLLFKHYLRYVNDQEPEAPNLLVEIAFEGIKQTLKRDLKSWEKTTESRSKAGQIGNLKRYNPDVYNDFINNKITFEEAIILAKDCKGSQDVAKLAVNVNDNVKVKDKVINNNTIKKETKFIFKKSLLEYGFEKDLVEDWLKVRKTKKATNTKTAFNGFIKEIEKISLKYNPNEILKICIEKSWSGFKSEWLNKNNNFNNNKTSENGKPTRKSRIEKFVGK